MLSYYNVNDWGNTDSQPGHCPCGVCIFSSRLRRFSLGTPVSSRIPKMYTLGKWAKLSQSESGCISRYPCDGRASCLGWGPALRRELPGEDLAMWTLNWNLQENHYLTYFY